MFSLWNYCASKLRIFFLKYKLEKLTKFMRFILMWPKSEEKLIKQGGRVYFFNNACTLPHFSKYRACIWNITWCVDTPVIESDTPGIFYLIFKTCVDTPNFLKIHIFGVKMTNNWQKVSENAENRQK